MVIALKTALIWLCIAILAILNGMVRDLIFAPLFGASMALPISGISLATIIFFVTFFAMDFIGAGNLQSCFLVGTQWVLMTLLFEFIFGHYFLDQPWDELMQVFNLTHGNLFLLALLSSFFSPYIVTQIRER